MQEPPPTADELVGMWSRVGVAGLVRFTPSGKFRIARNEADLRDAPFASGTYELDGRRITLSVGDTGSIHRETVWEARLAHADELHAVAVDDGLGLVAGSEFTLVRISPR